MTVPWANQRYSFSHSEEDHNIPAKAEAETFSQNFACLHAPVLYPRPVLLAL